MLRYSLKMSAPIEYNKVADGGVAMLFALHLPGNELEVVAHTLEVVGFERQMQRLLGKDDADEFLFHIWLIDDGQHLQSIVG
ncbi:MAG: hypothetical protein IJ196_00890 [Prevotella sp.]|nr:hypothetical protein [Prevotella sp.]